MVYWKPNTKRIVRDLSRLGDSVRIEVGKEGIRFVTEGEAPNGSVLLRQAEGAAISDGKITAAREEAVDGKESEGSTIVMLRSQGTQRSHCRTCLSSYRAVLFSNGSWRIPG